MSDQQPLPPGAVPPPPPAPAPAPVPAAPPPGPPPAPAAPGPEAWTDPKGLGAAIARLSSSSRKRGRTALLMVAALLGDESVEMAVQGKVLGFDGAAVLTSTRLIVINTREWQPDLVSVPPSPELTVQGWQDERTAALVVTQGENSLSIDGIDDRALAVEFAQRLRARSNSGGT